MRSLPSRSATGKSGTIQRWRSSVAGSTTRSLLSMAWHTQDERGGGEIRSPIRDLVDRLESDVTQLSQFITEQISTQQPTTITSSKMLSLTSSCDTMSPPSSLSSAIIPVAPITTLSPSPSSPPSGRSMLSIPPSMHDMSRGDLARMKGQAERMEVEIKTLVQFMDRMMDAFDDDITHPNPPSNTNHNHSSSSRSSLSPLSSPLHSPETIRRQIARRSVILNTNQTYRYNGGGSRGSIIFRLSQQQNPSSSSSPSYSSSSSSFLQQDNPDQHTIYNNNHNGHSDLDQDGDNGEPVVILDLLFESEMMTMMEEDMKTMGKQGATISSIDEDIPSYTSPSLSSSSSYVLPPTPRQSSPDIISLDALMQASDITNEGVAYFTSLHDGDDHHAFAERESVASEETQWNDIFSQFMSIMDPEEDDSMPVSPLSSSFLSLPSVPSRSSPQWSASRPPTPPIDTLSHSNKIGATRTSQLAATKESHRTRATSSPTSSSLSLSRVRQESSTPSLSLSAEILNPATPIGGTKSATPPASPRLLSPEADNDISAHRRPIRPHPPSSPSPSSRMKSIHNISLDMISPLSSSSNDQCVSTISTDNDAPLPITQSSSSSSPPSSSAPLSPLPSVPPLSNNESPPPPPSVRPPSPPRPASISRKKSLANMLGKLRTTSSARLVQSPTRTQLVVVDQHATAATRNNSTMNNSANFSSSSEPQMQYHTPMVAIPLNRSTAACTPLVVTFVSAAPPPNATVVIASSVPPGSLPSSSPSSSASKPSVWCEATPSSAPASPSAVRHSSPPSKPLPPPGHASNGSAKVANGSSSRSGVGKVHKIVRLGRRRAQQDEEQKREI
eukprot:TRINITY_DN10655_c0_g1_i11.p1 TRINITY_DN10655_c0_g1~~TRINITY_DN10655_c0_g1_i11.p1  ORF type:complete len:842 (+),score=215.43 TRINITY_DN10655_c0_g1_i11:216-2741(+)